MSWLESTVRAGEGPHTGAITQAAMSKLDSILDAVQWLKKEITSLERARDQARIHIQQFEQDYSRLQKIYNVMKKKQQNQFHVTQRREFPNCQADAHGGRHATLRSPIEPSQMSLGDLSWRLIPANERVGRESVSLRFSLSMPAVLCAVQFDPLGECVAFSDGRLLHVVSAKNGALMYSMEIPRSFSRNELHTRVLRFSNDGKYIAISSMASSISLFSTITRKCVGTLEAHKRPVTSLVFINESKQLLSGSYDGQLCLWDVESMSLVHSIQHGEGSDETLNKEAAIVSIATDREESFIAVGFMNGGVGIYDPELKQSMSTFSAHSEYLLCVEAVPNERAIVTTSQDKTAKLWSLRGVATCKAIYSGHDDFVISAAMGNDSQLLLTGSKDESIRGWDRTTGEPLFTITGHKNTLFEVHHHPETKSFVTCSGDGLVCVWDYVYTGCH